MKEKNLTKSHAKTQKEAIKEVDTGTVMNDKEADSKVLAEIEKHGLAPIEKIKIRNPITKKEAEIEIRRDGNPMSEMIVALTDPNKTQDQKDFAMSMYLWHRGAEGASFLVDIFRYKGEHTKETRVFKSQMRFDFEALVQSVADHYEVQATMTGQIMGIDIGKEMEAYRSWLISHPNKTYYDFFTRGVDTYPNEVIAANHRTAAAIISMAIFDLDESQKLVEARKNVANAREREKGGGIYVDKKGRAYTVNDPNIDDIIKADRDATAEINAE